MKLRYDPYQVFRFSKTPAGLYARQKWIGEAETPQWKTDFQKTVTALLADQLPDGSWHHEPVATIKHFPTISSAPWWCIPYSLKTRPLHLRLNISLVCKQIMVVGEMIYRFIRPLMRLHIWIYLERSHNLRGPLSGYTKSKTEMARGAGQSPNGIRF